MTEDDQKLREDEEDRQQEAEFWKMYQTRVTRLASGDLVSTPAEKAQIELLQMLHRLYRAHAWEKMIEIDPQNTPTYGEGWKVHSYVCAYETLVEKKFPGAWKAYRAMMDAVWEVDPL